MKDFPINVFPDVERNAFKKHLKKNVTEDYIKENLKLRNWECYKPFTDTGIDLIATKIIDGVRVYRYIQIKTRVLGADKKFGYTLTSKDFVTDPKKIYFLFCDTENDVIILPTYDYLKIFYENESIGKSHFATPSFRNNNNKLNSLKCIDGKWGWYYGKSKNHVDFTPYVNENGLARIESLDIETNYEEYSKEIVKMKFEMFYKMSKTTGNSVLFEEDSAKEISDKLNALRDMDAIEYAKQISEIDDKFKSEEPDLYKSYLGYIEGELEDIGDNEKEELTNN